MYSPSRFIAIDNEASHLAAITSGLQSLGIPCLGIHYDGSALRKEHFSGVRVLLLDLHLLSGAKASDDKAHYGAIAGLLEDNIGEEGGPFIIVLWTQHPQQAPELVNFLEKRLAVDHARPLTVIPLDKSPFVKLDSGTVAEPEKLKAALTEQILRNPQINAILSWETEVHQAAASTMASVLRLVPAAERTAAAFPAALDTVLSRLAIAAVGQSRVAGDIRGAINNVLTPVLADRLHAVSGAANAEIWSAAVTKHNVQLAPLDDAAASALNRMLHVETVGVQPGAWGAVVTCPSDWAAEPGAEGLFGSAYNAILESEFKIKPEDIAGCTPVLVRIGAACDYAQHRPSPVPYILGIERPISIKRGKFPDSVWETPRLEAGGAPFVLMASARFPLTLTESKLENLQPRYRLREQLLMELISKISVYISRPGKISV